MTPASASVEVGATTELAAAYSVDGGTPVNVDDSATWTSSAPGVATVDADGTVTGVAAGTATVTAVYAGASDTSDITVTAP